MDSMENTQGNITAGEQKINEYIKRVQNGEDINSLQLSSTFKKAVEDGLALAVQNSETHVEDIPSKNTESVNDFISFQDVESLKNAIHEFVPQKYQSLIDFPDILEEMWDEKYYIDAEMTKSEKEKRAYALSLVKMLSNKTNKDIQHAHDKEKVKEIRDGLVAGGSEQQAIKENNITSLQLENDILHRFENSENNFSATFWNNDKHQDALAIKDKTFVIADGAGSYEKSGALSGLLAEKLANRANQTQSFDEFQSLFQKENFNSLLDEIKSNENYQSFKPDRKFKNEGDGLATFIVAKESVDGDSIEYASIGDSPLFVVDKNDRGEIVGFQLVNDNINGQKIDQNNFYSPEVLSYLNNPETELIGIRKDGKLDTNHLSKIKFGKIAKKEGRSIYMGSDSIIKMMLNSPHALTAIGESKQNPNIRDAFNKKAHDESMAYPNLWDKDGNINFDVFSKEEKLLETLDAWKGNNYNYSDDLTFVAISAS